MKEEGYQMDFTWFLVATNSALRDLRFEITEGVNLTLGSSHLCDVVIKDVNVSRTFATLSLYKGVVQISEHSNSIEIFVSGKRLPGTSEVRT